MTTVRTRVFEITATVTFPTVPSGELVKFAERLSTAVSAVLQEYPAADAFLIEPLPSAGAINYGIRFNGADPIYIEEMADEILEKAVDLVADSQGTEHIEAEREESVLVLTR